MGTLQSLLKEYEKKRFYLEKEFINKKNELYGKHPRLEEIETELSLIAITISKNILKKDSSIDIPGLKSKSLLLKKERLSILDSANLSIDILSPLYECSLCKDTGYVNSSICTCLKQKILNIEYNKSNINNINKETFETFNLDFYSNKIDMAKYNSDISPRENVKNIKNISLNFIKCFDDINEKSLIFTGNSGIGKTFLSNAIAHELLKLEKTVLYQTSPILFDTIINYRFGKNDISKSIYENIYNVDLLIIDDLGTENLNSIVLSEIFNVINTRLLNNKKTVISTNLSLNDLFKKYEERIISRIIGNYTTCKFFGEDIRFIKKGIKI